MDQVSNDHDLLIRIDEKINNMLVDIAVERTSNSARQLKQETEYKVLRTDVDSLRMSRAQFYAIASTLSFLISLIVKIFWPK